MPTDILTAQDAPVTLTVKEDGQDVAYSLPLWTTKELLPVLSKLKAQRLASLKAIAKEYGVPPAQAAYQAYLEDAKPLNPYDAHLYFLSAEGVDECLIKSLVKGGTPQGRAEQVVARLRLSRKQDLAAEVAAICEPMPAFMPPPSTKANEGLGFGDPGQTLAQVPQAGLGERPTPAA